MPNEESNPQMNSHPPSSKRNLVIIVAVLISALVLVTVWFMFKYPTSTPTETTTPTTQAVPDIKSDADLKKLEDEVKGVDIDELSKDLDLNDQDASDF